MTAIQTEIHTSEPNSTEVPNTNSLTSKVTTYLRWAGSLLIILSAGNFMLQGYDDMLPNYRYWVALALTLLLCGGGFICAYVIRETIGARVFFGLATAFLTVQVTQVGAMFYSYWHGENALQPVYSWLQFMQVTPTTIGIDFILTAVLLLVISYAGFSILARKHLPTLLPIYIFANTLLLLPIRDSHWISVLLGVLFIVLTRIERQLHLDQIMQLPEGIAARSIICLPALILLGRSLLHPMSFSLAIVTLFFVTVWIIYDIKRYINNALLLLIGQLLGTMAALTIWLIIAEQFANLFGTENPIQWLPLAAILFALSEQVTFHARAYRSIGSIMAVYISYSAMLELQFLAPVYALAAGIALSTAGLKYREKVAFFSGNVCFAGGFLFYCQYAVNLYSAAPWVCSIALGLVVLLLASYLEKRESQIINKSKYYINKIRSWQ